MFFVWQRAAPYPAIEATYYANEETGYETYILPLEDRLVTKVSVLRNHMLVNSFLVVVIGLGIALRARRYAPEALGNRGADGASSATLGAWLGIVGIVMMLGNAFSCHFSFPAFFIPACSLYTKEALLDSFDAVGFLASAVILGHAAWLESSNLQAGGGRSVTALAMWGLASVLAMMFLEEIDWGQQFFGWDTPEPIARLNMQDATNIHNMFNNKLVPIYFAMGLAIFLGVLASLELRLRFPDVRLVRLLAPRDELFWMAASLCVASEIYVYSDTEVVETIMAMMALLYVWRVHADIREDLAATSRTAGRRVIAA